MQGENMSLGYILYPFALRNVHAKWDICTIKRSDH